MKGSKSKVTRAVDFIGWTAVIVGLICIMVTASRAAEPPPGGSCREDSLVKFVSRGKEVPSRLIGVEDKCDGFGGNLVYTPKGAIYLYVNFNIAGTIDLDEVDEAQKLIPESGELRDWFLNIKLAVVDKDWIKRVYNDEREAIVNFGGDTFFVSEKVLRDGRFTQVLRAFYSER